MENDAFLFLKSLNRKQEESDTMRKRRSILNIIVVLPLAIGYWPLAGGFHIGDTFEDSEIAQTTDYRLLITDF